MTDKEFNEILMNRIAKIQSTLASKAEEYSVEENRLHNFDRAAEIMDHPNGVVGLWGMALKHLVSVIDIVKSEDPASYSEAHCDEKIGDLINYLILLEAMLFEERHIKESYPVLRNAITSDV